MWSGIFQDFTQLEDCFVPLLPPPFRTDITDQMSITVEFNHIKVFKGNAASPFRHDSSPWLILKSGATVVVPPRPHDTTTRVSEPYQAGGRVSSPTTSVVCHGFSHSPLSTRFRKEVKAHSPLKFSIRFFFCNLSDAPHQSRIHSFGGLGW